MVKKNVKTRSSHFVKGNTRYLRTESFEIKMRLLPTELCNRV